jgi:hypothetical protein
VIPHYRFDCLEPAHAGHLDVHRDEVRLEPLDLRDRVHAVARGAGESEPVGPVHNVGNDPPHEGAVVCYQNGR